MGIGFTCIGYPYINNLDVSSRRLGLNKCNIFETGSVMDGVAFGFCRLQASTYKNEKKRLETVCMRINNF